MEDKIFSYGWEPILIHQILIGFEWIQENNITIYVKERTITVGMSDQVENGEHLSNFDAEEETSNKVFIIVISCIVL